MKRWMDGPKWLLKRSEVLTTGCWLWRGFLTPAGYPKFSNRYAHRLTYTLYIAPIPEQHDLHHKCYRRDCVNPYHLQPIPRGEHVSQHRARPARPSASLEERRTANRAAQRRWKAWRYEKSGCRQCRQPAARGRTLCATHLERQRTRKREARSRVAAAAGAEGIEAVGSPVSSGAWARAPLDSGSCSATREKGEVEP